MRESTYFYVLAFLSLALGWTAFFFGGIEAVATCVVLSAVFFTGHRILRALGK